MKIGQLNTISEYDINGSIVNIDLYVKKAKEKGYSYVGIKGKNMFYFPHLASRCEKENITPVFLISIKIKTEKQILDAALVVLNNIGYQNICYLKNHLDSELLTLDELKKVSKGNALILETNLNFEFKLFQDMMAKEILKIKKIFEDNFYLGVGLYTQADYDNVSQITDFAKTCSYDVIPFHEVRYLEKKDAYYQEIFLASIEKRQLEKVEEGPYFLLSTNSLEKIYSKQLLENQESLFSKINFNFFEKKGSLISFDSDDKLLKDKAYKGMKELKLDTKEYKERLDYELKIISEMKFSSYFLIVEDYVNFARINNIKIGPSRGSAGGSLTCYFLGITSLDPIKYNLSFERFLNPKRITMPDIDIDFDSERRDEVVSYLYNKYKEKKNQVCNIVTFSTLKPRSAIKFVASTLGYPDKTLEPLLSTISTTASDFLDTKKDPYLGDKFKEISSKKSYLEIIKVADKILGLVINTSIHASGVIISDKPLDECTQIIRKENNTILCGYEYVAMERLGFLKLDILALSNLTFIRHVEERILKEKKEIPNIYSDLENKEVYSTLCNKHLYNIFQLDSSSIVLKDVDLVKPDSFKDLCELVDLIRPGAKDYVELFSLRKHKKEKITYLDDSLEPILNETYGIMLYQEQIMEVVKTIAGFSLSEADLLRRAISKKSETDIKKYYSKFIEGATSNGISKEKADKIYSDIEKFSNYGFNKAHSYGYGLITYTLLYYKTFFLKEFYTESLLSIKLGTIDFIKVKDELLFHGYKFVNPSINESLLDEVKFKEKEIYLPLKINGVNNTLIEKVIIEREKGKYTSYLNFLIRNKDLFNNDENKNALSNLIDAGVFDKLEQNRVKLKSKTNLYLDAVKFYSDEKEIESFLNSDEKIKANIIEVLVNEKISLGIIASVNINDIVEQVKGYQPFIVLDNKNLSKYNTIVVTSNYEEYVLKINTKISIENNKIVMVKGNLNNRYKIKNIEDIKLGKLKGEIA